VELIELTDEVNCFTSYYPRNRSKHYIAPKVFSSYLGHVLPLQISGEPWSGMGLMGSQLSSPGERDGFK
jgi:hypothetical protein